MKLIIAIFLTTLSIVSYSQNGTVFIEFNKDFELFSKDEGLGAYEYILQIHSDYYSFVLNLDPSKSLEGNGVEVTSPKILTIKELKSMGFCDIHNLFSDNKIFLVKQENNQYLSWFTFFYGTMRYAKKHKAQY